MISIIIPTLNEEKALAKTLASLVPLRGRLCEIIVSDGGSTDGTLAIAKRYADKIVRHDGSHRQTIGEGRNLGAREARGEYLVFLDADVRIPEPEAFMERALACFEKRPNLAALGGTMHVVPEATTSADRFFLGILNWYNRITNNVLGIGGAPGEFQMVEASAFQKVGGYNETLAAGEDYDLFARLAKLGETRIEPALRVFHSGRRAHRVGWLRLFPLWIANSLSIKVRKRAISKEWKEVR